MNQSKYNLKNRTEIKEAYKKRRLHKLIFILIIFITIFAVSGIASTLGAFPIRVFEVYAIILRNIPKIVLNIGFIVENGINAFFLENFDIAEVVVWNMRLPRIIMAVLAGIGLGIAGAVMQAILRNPLASPFTLGISSGAGFGAALAIIMGFGILGGRLLIVANAFVFALIPAFVIMALAKYRRATPEMMILSGIAISSIFGAATTFMMFFADEFELRETVFWMVGDVGRGTWPILFLIITLMTVFIAPLIRKSWDLNIMVAGDETAKSLGVDVGKLRVIAMILASLLAATVVSFVGTIGFIGLVAPHICRMIIGGDNRYVIPASGLFGGAMLLVADTLARTIIAPVILPVGVLTAFMGGPLFLYLLIKQKKEYW